MIKKIFSVLIILLMLAMTINSALAMDEVGRDYNGAYDWDFYKSKLNLIDKLFTNSPSSSLAIVGGALCSNYPDWSNEGVINDNKICWNNINSGSPSGQGVEHIGVAYQIFKVEDNGQGGWTALHPKKITGDGFMISAGQKKCVDIEEGQYYYRQVFYCDDLQKSCSNPESICKTRSGTKRERICTDTGKETVFVDWIDDSVGYCEGYVPPTENNDNANSGDDGSGEDPSLETLSGEFTNIVIPTNVKINEDFEILATFTAKEKGTYYIEAGTEEKASTLAIVTAEGSQCDGSKEWAGKFIDLEADEIVNMRFKLEGKDQIGLYGVVIGAYTGCLTEEGKQINMEGGFINFVNQQEENEEINYLPVLYKWLGIGIALIGIGFLLFGNWLGLILLVAGLLLWLINFLGVI